VAPFRPFTNATAGAIKENILMTAGAALLRLVGRIHVHDHSQAKLNA
jgi:hypothetical protein